MKVIDIKSDAELSAYLKKNERVYVLLYKSGSENSDCAFGNLKNASDRAEGEFVLLTADVNSVRDIHPKYNIETAPTLLEFENSRLKGTVKGCQSKDFYASHFNNALYSSHQNEGKQQKRVVVYSTPTCPHCNSLKDYLKRNQIQFRDIDVSKDQKMAQELVRKSGQQGVPQTEINGKIIVGFNRPKINELLGIQG